MASAKLRMMPSLRPAEAGGIESSCSIGWGLVRVEHLGSTVKVLRSVLVRDLERILLNLHMGSCQNYGPFLGTLNIRCRIIVRTLILTTTHMSPMNPRLHPKTLP